MVGLPGHIYSSCMDLPLHLHYMVTFCVCSRRILLDDILTFYITLTDIPAYFHAVRVDLYPDLDGFYSGHLGVSHDALIITRHLLFTALMSWTGAQGWIS